MNDAESLKEYLFETIKSLRDVVHPMAIERAKAISEVAQTIINIAKVEVECQKLTGKKTNNFLGMHDMTGTNKPATQSIYNKQTKKLPDGTISIVHTQK